MGDGHRCTKGTVIELPPSEVKPTTPVSPAGTYKTTLHPGNEVDSKCLSVTQPASSGITFSNRSILTTPSTSTTPPPVKLITYDPWLPSHFTPTISDHYDCQRCHVNATCWYGICQCKQGFTGDGMFCIGKPKAHATPYPRLGGPSSRRHQRVPNSHRPLCSRGFLLQH